jgi:hypothetical protein
MLEVQACIDYWEPFMILFSYKKVKNDSREQTSLSKITYNNYRILTVWGLDLAN